MQIWKNYGPIVVFVPALIGIHYGWFALQQRFVPEDARLSEQPILSVSTAQCNTI